MVSSERIMFCMSATPFNGDASLDEEALRVHLRRMVAAGNGVYLGSGGAGEGHVLSVAELRRIYDIGVQECKGKVATYANPREARSADQHYEVIREAVAAGVDCVQIYPLDGGHGMRPNEREQETYYRDLLDAIDHPVSVSVHISAGYMAPISLLKRLVDDYKRLIAINVMGPPNSYFVELRDTLPRSIKMYTGITNLVQVLSLGADGCLSAENNVIPNLCRAIIDHYESGDTTRMNDAVLAVSRFGNVVHHWSPSTARWVKMAMKVVGIGNGVIRKPYLLPGEEDQRRMAEAFDTLRIMELERQAELAAA
jgi:4-hydroxy-tetrahydrodipicolinate synthase